MSDKEKNIFGKENGRGEKRVRLLLRQQRFGRLWHA